MAGFTKIETEYRRIISEIPHPDSRAVIAELSQLEPHSMTGFSPIVWSQAEGFQVWDGHGNQWLDFTSAVVLANAGHAAPRIGQALRAQLDSQLWHNYCNPSEIRLKLLKTMREILPAYLDKIFLLCTGSEATEAAIKLMRMHGQTNVPGKYHILAFDNSYHGRTMGAQRAGGFLDQQAWMGEKPGGFHHIPYPECARCPWGKAKYDHCGAECLDRSLAQLRAQGVQDEQVAGVMIETFQGPTVAFMPLDYIQALRAWANKHQILLAFDDIQAGFGRTGKWFGFEHYGIETDLLCMAKGMTSSLPMSAVAGRAAILDLPRHGEMSSTHTGNPLCCAATIANIQTIQAEGLVENAAALESVVRQRLEALQARFPDHVGSISGKGLAWGVYLLHPETRQLDVGFANKVVTRCLELGLLMLQTGRGTLKIAPPLCITQAALLEGLAVIEQVLAETIGCKEIR